MANDDVTRCRLVVGLGNPGPKYRGHRHNLGFMVVDRLCAEHGVGPLREKFKGLFAKGPICGRDVILLKPMTYMNLSGESLRPALDFFSVPLDEVLVIHDELDLSWGVIRLKLGGGTAGHNGLKSIQTHCGGPDFMRLRIGIGRPRGGQVQRHVLSDFSREEGAELENVLQSASVAVEDVLDLGIRAAMNRHNSKA